MTTLDTPASQRSPDLKALQSQVAGSSFYTAMRLMPEAERAGMYAIYAFCRQVDDIADDGARERPARTRALDAWRRDLNRLYAGGDPGQAAFLADAMRRFDLQRSDFEAVIDGMQMDVDTDIVAPPWSLLDLYCDRVASAVGRLSVKVFGMDGPVGVELAHHLGRALQLTNILRDLDEDAGIGRLYLPRETLEAAGVDATDPLRTVADPHVDAACREVAARARTHYAESDRIMAGRVKGRMVTPKLMSRVYGAILNQTEAVGWAPPRARAKIGKGRLLWIVLRTSLAG